MIDRSYLPYQSARDYQDRGMAKWMGFYLSEHTTALSKAKSKEDLTPAKSHQQLLFLAGQLYASQAKSLISIAEKERRVYYQGQIVQLGAQHLLIKNQEHYHNLPISDILDIDLLEDDERIS